MPPGIKTLLSIAVLIVGAIVLYIEHQVGQPHLGWVSAGLAVFMVISLWMFPETGNKKNPM